MKRLVLLFIFSCIGASIYAQEDTSLIKQFGLEANLVSPGVGASYELPLLKGWGSVAIDDSRFKPYTRIAVKYYYNRDKRARKGKEINNNRGNFIGIQNKLMYGDITTETTFALNEIYWGVQTEIAKNMLLTFHIGGAHYYRKDKEHFYSPLIDLRVKYILF